MSRRRLAVITWARAVMIGALLGATPPQSDAQTGARIPQIGVLALGTEAGDVSASGRYVREGLQELGWVEGENVAVRVKLANLSRERLGMLAAELVQEKVDVIVAIGAEVTVAARRATSSIPIVMAGVGDPVGTGLVKNLARPEGNITGVSLLVGELTGKRLQLLKDVLPGLSRLGVLHAEATGGLVALKQTQALAPRLGLDVRTVVFRGLESVPDHVAALRGAGAQALLVLPNPGLDEARFVLAEATMKQRLPTMFAFREYVEAGGLMSYGADLTSHQRRAARYVDQILKGVRPGDLPIEQPTQVDFVVNLRTAKGLGMTIPPAVLVRADRVIQ